MTGSHWHHVAVSEIVDPPDNGTPKCGQCRAKLRADSPSPDFCGEQCQQRWNAKKASAVLPTPVQSSWWAWHPVNPARHRRAA